MNALQPRNDQLLPGSEIRSLSLRCLLTLTKASASSSPLSKTKRRQNSRLVRRARTSEEKR